MLIALLACTEYRLNPVDEAEEAAPDASEDLGSSASADDEVPETLSGEGVAPGAPELFDPDHVVTVAISLDADDWSTLRNQERSRIATYGEGCQQGPFESPYTAFEGDIEIDGVVLESVSLKKKGFFGSVNVDTPSFNIDLDDLVDGQALDGVEHVMLNNVHRDPAIVRQCLAYELLAEMGMPSSACTYADVTVNDESLGLYVLLEKRDDHWLERVYGDDDVVLMEGTHADFRQGWEAAFELKEGDADEAAAALKDATVAVASGDYDQIAAHFDLDVLYATWVGEALLGAWDGYANATTNFYVVLDPSDGKWDVLPWGLDEVLEHSDTTFSTGRPDVAASSAVVNALLETDEGRARYQDELVAAVEGLWAADDLRERMARHLRIVAPYHPNPEVLNEAAGGLLDVLSTRPELLLERQGDFDQAHGPLNVSPCYEDRGSWLVDFSLTAEGSEVHLDAELDGLLLDFDQADAGTSTLEGGGSALKVRAQLDGWTFDLQAVLAASELEVGTTALDGYEGEGEVVLTGETSSGLLSYLSGELYLDEVGEELRGSLWATAWVAHDQHEAFDGLLESLD